MKNQKRYHQGDPHPFKKDRFFGGYRDSAKTQENWLTGDALKRRIERARTYARNRHIPVSAAKKKKKEIIREQKKLKGIHYYGEVVNGKVFRCYSNHITQLGEHRTYEIWVTPEGFDQHKRDAAAYHQLRKLRSKKKNKRVDVKYRDSLGQAVFELQGQ